MWIYFFDITVYHFGDHAAVASVSWRFSVAFFAHGVLSATVQVSLASVLSFLWRTNRPT